MLIVNNSGAPIELNYENQRMIIQDKKTLPVTWNLENIFISVKKDISSSFLYNLLYKGCIRLEENKYIVLDTIISTPTENCYNYIISINPPYVISNLLPCSINLKCNNEIISQIFSGDQFNLTSKKSSPSHIFSLELLVNNSVLLTEEFDFAPSFKRIKVVGQENWKISANISNKNAQSIEVCFYSQYLIVNTSDFNFSFNNCIVPKGCISFYQTKKEALKLHINDEFQSDSSEKFNLKALGMSSCVIIPLKNPIFKSFCVGIRIMQASSSLSLTKIIKITPRFVISNFLDFTIYIRQFSKSFTRVVEIEQGKHVNYQFDNFEEGTNVEISEDKYQWSGPFSLNNIEDFQIRFKAAPREIPVRKNIFARDPFWYLSCPRNHMFYYARININSENDATINIAITKPRIPNFKIHNATDEPIVVKQSKCKEHVVQIPPGTSEPWAFDNHLLNNKKVTVKIGKIKGKYSLEKIKEKSKNIGDYSTSIKFEGESRMLTIYKVEETEIFLRINLIKQITKKYIRKLNINLIGIHFSLLDENNSEHFLISMNEIIFKNTRDEDSRNSQVKTRNKIQILIGHFQIDNMIVKKHLFPVVAYQSEIIENTPFFELRYDREYTTGNINSPYIVPIDRILEFELQMQPLNLKLNYEVMLSFFDLYSLYMKGYYQQQTKIKSKSVAKIEELYPELNVCLQVPDASVQSVKTYLKYVRVHGMKIIFTFNNSINLIAIDKSSELTSSVSNFFLDLASIDGSPLKFTEIILQHSFQNLYSLSWALAKNYMRQGLLQFYRILGSSELLGNPIGLIDKLGTGVYEFFNEPAKGLLKGPKAFINGMGKGVRSLVSNVIAGSFESVANITGSLYKIISYENAALKKSIYDDLGLMDIASGVSGIVVKPYQGFKKHGAKGLIKGIGSGIVGIVVSPVAAVLHFSSTVSSKVAEGAGMLRINPNLTGRVRFPRNYSVPRKLETYDNDLAKLRYFVLLKEFKENEVKAVIGLEKESIAVLEDRIIIIVNEVAVDEIEVNRFKSKEVHFHDKKFLLKLKGERDFYISSVFYVPIMKLFLALNLKISTTR